MELGVDEIKNWFGDVMGMTEEKITKKILHIKMEGKRPRGRSWTRWINQIRKDIDERKEGILSIRRKQEVGE